MKTERAASGMVEVRRLLGGEGLLPDSERQLLDRFLGQGDELAFEAIIARHGPMVVAVCRSILPDPTDVDDAFQATFLVLVQRARSIRDGDRLSPWLHGVARRVALRAKANAGKRRVREGVNPAALTTVAAPPAPAAEDRELAAVVHAELGRLPSREQLAISLCHLEGLSHREAADRLGWPLGTVKARINRGHARLRGRLARRGLRPADSALLAVGADRSVVLVTRSLAAATTRAALASAGGREIAVTSIAARVQALTRGGGRRLMFTPPRILAATLTALTAAGVVALHPPAPPVPEPPTAPPVNLTPPVTWAPLRFDRIVIDPAFPAADQVEVADVDGDAKPDLVVLGGPTIAWYQNPSWTKRIIATGGNPLPGNLSSSATVDLDGDGRAEIAIGCDFAPDTPTRGQLFLASPGRTLDAPWTFRKIQDVPSIYRVRWGDMDGDRRPELIVAPRFGPRSAPPTYDQDMARVVELHPDPDHPTTGAWSEHEILRRRVVHSIEVTSALVRGPQSVVLGRVAVVSQSGVSFPNYTALGPNGDRARTGSYMLAGGVNPIAWAAGPPSRWGSGEFRSWHDRDGGVGVTIDPRNGSELVAWRQHPRPAPPPTPATPIEAATRQVTDFVNDLRASLTPRPPVLDRFVIDDTLGAAHALWTADVDGDGADEVFVGTRGQDHRVLMYRHGATGWDRTIIDQTITPNDLRGGDLDADGVPDLVAVGGSPDNVVWYRPSRLARPDPAAPPR